LLRFEAAAAAAGVSGTSVERFAAASVAGGVFVGCAGGGWRRLVTGLREPHPEKQTQRTQRTQSSQRKKVFERNDCRLPQSPGKKAAFAGRDGAAIDSAEFLNGPLAS
jgi:hypothetical protein